MGKADHRKKLHDDVWRAAIRFYVYRTPKRNERAVAYLRRTLNRYTRSIREGRA